jgi:hypothetical protein
MRFMGHNALAILVAAIVIYAIEFVIFGMLISADQYQSMVGLTSEQLHPDRMLYGVAPPLLAAVGLSLAVKWRNAPGWMGGLTTGVLMAIFFAFAVALYGFVYGSHASTSLAVDLAHFVIAYGAAGAVLGAWK